jgi:hypothetical protein
MFIYVLWLCTLILNTTCFCNLCLFFFVVLFVFSVYRFFVSCVLNCILGVVYTVLLC